MIALQAPVVSLVAWLLFSGKVHCHYDHLPEKTSLARQCEKMCTGETPETTDKSQDFQVGSKCLKECLFPNKGENYNATHSPLHQISTSKPSLSSTADVIKEDRSNDCPDGSEYKPRANEVIPGNISALEVTFAQDKSQDWVATASWTAPKDVESSMNWRGYLVVWDVETREESDLEIMAQCKMLPKNQTNFDINATDGGKHPVGIYIIVVALPTDRRTFVMSSFHPKMTDLHVLYKPLHRKEGEQSQSPSPEGIAIISVAGLLSGLVFVGLFNICFITRKRFSAYHTKILPIMAEKKTGDKADGQSDKLIV